MKKCFIVTYELKTPWLNQEKLIKQIKTASWVKLGPTTYAIVSYYNSTQIRDILLESLYEGDKIYVSELNRESSWYGLDNNVSKWLRENQ